ncbi:cell adhesion molecule 2-like [Macrobrachium rosenbergii]|uniref:cell adhesion molecule 2-like n=1 Tax=Macrobrachium rosenbergii TaxID=79674 RepID=UPI0034D5DEBD
MMYSVGQGAATLATRIMLAAILLLVFSSDAECIKIVEMRVPSSVMAGDTVHLQCDYDLESDTLYSLTWWREQKQFYQYSPTSGKRKSKYDSHGIEVDEDRSTKNTVVLRNVSFDTAGRYKCEVVAEFPTYEKDSDFRDMRVIDIPDRVPVIQADRIHYHHGDLLVANCTTSGSKPAPHIHWQINGKTIPEAYSNIISENETKSRLISLTSELRIRLTPDHFRDFQLRLTCIAEISPIYEQSAYILLTGPGYKRAGPIQKYYKNQGPRLEISIYQWTLICFTMAYVYIMNLGE